MNDRFIRISPKRRAYLQKALQILKTKTLKRLYEYITKLFIPPTHLHHLDTTQPLQSCLRRITHCFRCRFELIPGAPPFPVYPVFISRPSFDQALINHFQGDAGMMRKILGRFWVGTLLANTWGLSQMSLQIGLRPAMLSLANHCK